VLVKVGIRVEIVLEAEVHWLRHGGVVDNVSEAFLARRQLGSGAEMWDEVRLL
jgi:hypothetical protein